jgi:hypothetical protein
MDRARRIFRMNIPQRPPLQADFLGDESNNSAKEPRKRYMKKKILDIIMSL